MFTVQELIDKTFAKAEKGYSCQQVEDFMEEIINDYEALMMENDKLKAELTDTKAALSAAKEASLAATREMKKVDDSYQRPVQPAPAAPAAAPAQLTPEALRELLETAQEVVSRDVVAKAEAEAERIRSSAREEMETRLGDLAGERDRMQAEVDRLRKAAAEYRSKLKQLFIDLDEE